MTPARLLLAAALAAPTAATAQTVEIIRPAENGADAPAPTTIVEAEPGATGEAPVIDADALVEIDENFVLPTLNLPVYALDDYDLVDRNGNDLGQVEAVLGPDAQTATAVAVEFDGPGWFLTDDDVTRVVDISAFSIEDDLLVIDITEDNVRALPVYADD